MTRIAPKLIAAASAATLLLAGCGGGEDAPTGGGGTLTLSATTPSTFATAIDLATATAKGNNARAADGFSSVPYCEVFWENATGGNGKKYAVQVYFRQGDKLPMHVSLVEVTVGWAIFNNNSGAAITGLTVDTAAKTVAFNNKVLAGNGTEVGTLAGTVGFQANTGTPACGA